MELITSMWRQDRLRDLELAVLTAGPSENPPSEATAKKLGTFASYGDRIDKDIGRALQALRVLRNRPDAWIDELPDGTSEPGVSELSARNFTNELSGRTSEPDTPAETAVACTAEPERPPNRHQRRALAAMARKGVA